MPGAVISVAILSTRMATVTMEKCIFFDVSGYSIMLKGSSVTMEWPIFWRDNRKVGGMERILAGTSTKWAGKLRYDSPFTSRLRCKKIDK